MASGRFPAAQLHESWRRSTAVRVGGHLTRSRRSEWRESVTHAAERAASNLMPAVKQPHLIRPRLFVGDALLIGPGKIDLLIAVRDTGSISAAARATGIGYKRAWVLLDEVRTACGRDVVATAAGGSGGGGASLTDLALTLIDQYQAIETACRTAAAPHLKRLARALG